MNPVTLYCLTLDNKEKLYAAANHRYPTHAGERSVAEIMAVIRERPFAPDAFIVVDPYAQASQQFYARVLSIQPVGEQYAFA